MLNSWKPMLCWEAKTFKTCFQGSVR